MPRPFPKEFREDVVRVARDRGPGVTREQIGQDFEVHPMTLSKWLRQADVDDGVRPGRSTTERADLRAANCRRSGCLWPPASIRNFAMGEDMPAGTSGTWTQGRKNAVAPL